MLNVTISINKSQSQHCIYNNIYEHSHRSLTLTSRSFCKSSSNYDGVVAYFLFAAESHEARAWTNNTISPKYIRVGFNRVVVDRYTLT